MVNCPHQEEENQGGRKTTHEVILDVEGEELVEK